VGFPPLPLRNTFLFPTPPFPFRHASNSGEGPRVFNHNIHGLSEFRMRSPYSPIHWTCSFLSSSGRPPPYPQSHRGLPFLLRNRQATVPAKVVSLLLPDVSHAQCFCRGTNDLVSGPPSAFFCMTLGQVTSPPDFSFCRSSHQPLFNFFPLSSFQLNALKCQRDLADAPE